MQSNIPQLDRGALKRVLGIFDLFAIGYGDLGSSIYYALGITAFFALGATPIAMLLAGLVFVCTALSYAELSAAFHEGGGTASYSRHAFNDLVSFVAGWGLLLDYIVTIAISAFTIGPYLSSFFPILNQAEVQILFTIFLILVLLVINVIGVKQSTRTSFFLMAFTVLAQLLIIAIGIFTAEDIGRVFSQMRINQAGVDWSPDWNSFIKGTAMAMVAYTGIESIAQLGSESKKPARTVPKAIMLTMTVLLVMYFGLSYVGFSVLSPYELGHTYQSNPITGIVAHLPWGSSFLLPSIGFLAAVTLFVAANAGLIGASRLSFNMGAYYQLPRFFYKVHARFKTPHVALTFFALLASVVVAMSGAKMSFLADLYNFGAQIAFFFTHVSLIVMRFKKPNMKRPFKVPLNIKIKGYQIPLTAILGALASFAVWAMVVITKPDGRYLGIGWVIVGLIMYYYYRRQKKISPTGQVKIEKIQLPRIAPLEVKNILLPLRSTTQTDTVQLACEMARLHKAKLTVLHVIEVPFSLPLETALPHRIEMAGTVLKTAEAFALELELNINLDIVRARSITEAIIDVAQRGGHDLLLLEANHRKEKGVDLGLGKIISEILQNPPCRLWICNTTSTK
jgi:APA family basic amino acid/polyamine antiporter